MTFKTYLSVFGNDDKKHDLERKFGYKYRALERVYPDADKLPDDEIKKAIDIFYDGDANEDTDVMLNRVKDYTAKNEPVWNEKYFNPKPKPMHTSVSQPQTINPQPQMPSLSVKQPLKGFGDYMADVKQIGNKIWDSAFQYLPTSRMGDTVGTLHAVKQNMDQHNLINGDNYYHRLGMCLNGQKGLDSALYSFGAGLLKEGYDLARKNHQDYKNNNLSWENFKNHVKDSVKDIKNNYEGAYYGLTNLNESCRIWLNDLDVNTNEWRKNEENTEYH